MAEKIELVYARDIYGKTLVELGKKHSDIVVLDADLSGSTRTAFFQKEFPGRFFNFGVAEQNMVATAAGFASCGKVVFASTFAMFATGRCWDQLRNAVCYNNFDVKIVATHSGITVGEDGASHQALEDVAILRAIPNITIVVPSDACEVREAVIAAYETPGPFYIRLGRSKVPVTCQPRKQFLLRKGEVLREGNHVAIVACGILVSSALEAANRLAKEGINACVVNMHTIKPIDRELIISLGDNFDAMVICEEHMQIGGLFSAVSEVLAEEKLCCRVVSLSVKNRYGQSGSPEELIREYHLSVDDIIAACRSVARG